MDSAAFMSRLEWLAPLVGASPWDHSGVQIAGTRSAIRRVAVALDPSPEFVSAALEDQADLILTHHPLSLEPRFLDRMDDYWEVARLVLGQGAWLYAAHTSLDVQSAGPAGWLARRLGLRNLANLESVVAPVGQAYLAEETGDEPLVGFGLAGDLPEALPWAEFKGLIAEALDLDHWLQSGPEPGLISRVAYCPGSGGSLVREAELAGASVYITGEIKHHVAVGAGFPLMDVGHFVLEEEMVRQMAELIRDWPEDLEVKFFAGRDAKTLCQI